MYFRFLSSPANGIIRDQITTYRIHLTLPKWNLKTCVDAYKNLLYKSEFILDYVNLFNFLSSTSAHLYNGSCQNQKAGSSYIFLFEKKNVETKPISYQHIRVSICLFYLLWNLSRCVFSVIRWANEPLPTTKLSHTCCRWSFLIDSELWTAYVLLRMKFKWFIYAQHQQKHTKTTHVARSVMKTCKMFWTFPRRTVYTYVQLLIEFNKWLLSFISDCGIWLLLFFSNY